MTVGGPCLGVAVDVFDDHGRSLRGEVGELVCTEPWPSMSRGLWEEPERYLETYWSRWPDVWAHGDFASVEDGFWFVHGRSDDTIKVAGKRLNPAEVEAAVTSHPSVVEAAAVGVPNEVKGQEVWGFAVLIDGVHPDDGLRQVLVDLVATNLGASFRPAAVRFVSALPKTRSGKLMRRAVRAVAMGADPGDLSALEDPSVLDAIRRAT
jgi:acetyl-CoA synthetase